MRRSLAALMTWMACLGVARADAIPHLRVSWREKDAGVVAFAPDSRSLVSAGAEGFRLRDAATGEVRAALNDRPWPCLNKPTFTPDGRLLLAQVMSDRLQPLIVHDVLAWDVATGQPRGSFPYVAEHLDEGSFTLSRDGRLLAFVDNTGRLPVVPRTLKGASDAGEFTIELNANPAPPRVKVWDVAAWKEVAVMDGGRPLAFSTDGRTLATGDPDGNKPGIRLWDANSGRRLATLEGRRAGPWPLAFSPDGRFLAAASPVGGTTLWEVAGGRRWPLDDRVWNATPPAFSPDGRWLFPAGVPWLEAGTGQRSGTTCLDLAAMPPRPLDLGPGKVIVSPDGRRYATVPEERPYDRPVPLTFFDLPERRETGRLALAGPTGVRFSPDGRWLAAQVVRHVDVSPTNSGRFVAELALVDPASARRVATIAPPEPSWGNIGWAFAPDGRSLTVRYHPGDGSFRAGQPDPSAQPVTVEVWDLLPPP